MAQSIPGQRATTSGSPTREARSLRDPPMRFALRDEAARLAAEPEWTDGDRNSIVLAKDARFRMLLSVLRQGAVFHGEEADSTASVQLISGDVAVECGGAYVDLAPGEVAVLDAGDGWSLHATRDSSVLLTLSWPTEKVRV